VDGENKSIAAAVTVLAVDKDDWTVDIPLSVSLYDCRQLKIETEIR